jgi:hypothetical protein
VGTGDPEFYACDSDDATINPYIAEALRKLPGQTFKNWARSAGANGITKTQVWSGIMVFVVDDFPYVGAIPGKNGQFICAGYTGRGKFVISLNVPKRARLPVRMARAFLCTRALGQLIRAETVDKRVPPAYMDLEHRWAVKETLSGLLGRRPYPSL